MIFSRHRGLTFILAMMVAALSSAGSSEETCSPITSPCKMKEMQSHLQTSIEIANKVMDDFKNMKYTNCPPKPEDCDVVFNCGKLTSGIYTLWPRSRILTNSVQAYCDMETDGGGWTVFQRRGNFGRAQDYFYQDWNSYKEGFGYISEDFWMGNDLLFAFTNQKKYSIRFDLKDLDGNSRWAKYDQFWIDSEEYNYTLHVRGYKGNAGDSFSIHHSGMQFSTKDRDNDKYATKNCAASYKGAWWYSACHSSNLNGLYLNGPHPDKIAQGVNWYSWLHHNYSLPFTEMKIKPLFSAKETTGEISTSL